VLDIKFGVELIRGRFLFWCTYRLSERAFPGSYAAGVRNEIGVPCCRSRLTESWGELSSKRLTWPLRTGISSLVWDGFGMIMIFEPVSNFSEFSEHLLWEFILLKSN